MKVSSIPHLMWYGKGDKTPEVYNGPAPNHDTLYFLGAWIFFKSSELRQNSQLEWLYGVKTEPTASTSNALTFILVSIIIILLAIII